MPSACAKVEKKAPSEPEEAIKQCISVVEKKVRNLEKRKGKLDQYREQFAKGEVALNEDQKDAISKYDAVINNLEFARELQKQFSEINEKAEKLLKKREKYERLLRHNEEVARVQELLQLQSLLDNMGGEDVREDFKSGKKGAPVLSEDSLNQLDELYKLISPSRDTETSYTEQLSAASEHIVNYLEGKEKDVAGTTYKQLKDLVSQINQSGYFDQVNTETVTEEAVAEETAVEPEEPQETETEQEDIAVEPITETHPTSLPSQSTYDKPAVINQTQEPPTYNEEEQDSFFSTPAQLGRQREFQEIVSSVQGSFNFLQESEIEKQKHQNDVPHLDPAVVVAHPLQQAYTGSFQLEPEQQYTQTQTGVESSSSQFDSLSTQVTSAQYVAPAAWSQHKQGESRWSSTIDGMEQNWPSTEQTSTTMSQSVVNQTQSSWSTDNQESWADQAGSQQAPSGQWANETSTQQAWSSVAASQETKASSLNPEANIFNMYQNQSGGFPDDNTNFDGTNSNMDGQKSDAPGSYQQCYRSGRREYDNSRGGSGYRGGRGGPRGMSNGFSQQYRGGSGQNRGGFERRGGGFNDRGNRGGGNRGMRGGPRGGSGTGQRGRGANYSRPTSAQQH